MSSSSTAREPDAQRVLHAGVPAPEAAEAPVVLSTLNTDGTRRWLRPRPSPGRFLTARRVVAYALIAVFTLLPWININGKPTILLDLTTRRFHLFGTTFFPTETLLLALLMVALLVGIFLITAVLGRVWCGWACPQTVYLEFVFRPIERLFEGAPGRAKKGWIRGTPLGTVLKYAAYVLVSAHLANTFLAYFVGVENLKRWTLSSPLEHWPAFVVFGVVTALMLFDFAFFREQTCLVACPYGRFQSVLLDRHSLVVGYDRVRGEPRGRRGAKGGRAPSGDVSLPVLGDCVDCGLCVATCPTGIDIRNGLQMECVHCTQCIDACDAVMDKVGSPRGLIRYASQAAMAGEKRRWLRPRLVVYPLVMGAVLTGFVVLLLGRAPLEAAIQRGRGAIFVELEGGLIGNTVQIKMTNRMPEQAEYLLASVSPASAEIRTESNPVRLGPGEMKTVPATLVLPRSALSPHGDAELVLSASGGPGYQTKLKYRLVGPVGTPGEPSKGGTP